MNRPDDRLRDGLDDLTHAASDATSVAPEPPTLELVEGLRRLAERYRAAVA